MKRTYRLALTVFASLCFLARGGEPESTAVLQPKIARHSYDAMPKDPLASAFFSATICGTGQIYNREYARGLVTGGVFWTSLFTAEYLLSRWVALNTDTFSIAEADDPTVTHQVTAMKPEDQWVGLPTEEKALLITAVAAGAAAYIFGIYDSYRGAHRYNTKLFAGAAAKPELYCALSRERSEAGVRVRF